MDRREKKRAALERLGDGDNLLVALSGGVDSAVLLALALEALGPERVLAVTGDSPSLDRADLDEARRVARRLGATHEVVRTLEMSRPDYRANRGDRCFHCRSELFDTLARLARERGFARIAYGAIVDDLGDSRPGMRAADERGILAPLLEAGLDKADVRALAAEAGLPLADKPANACLASRIPVGTEVTSERLERVARAETKLRALGLERLRVRDHGEVARVELDAATLAALADAAWRRRIVDAVQAAGFRFVTIDLEGYRPAGAGRGASVNAALPMAPDERAGTDPTRDKGQ